MGRGSRVPRRSRPGQRPSAIRPGHCCSSTPPPQANCVRLNRSFAGCSARHPEWQFAVTTFSPSGSAVAQARCPWTSRDSCRGTRPLRSAVLLDALAPTAIVVCKLDLWPVLALAAQRPGHPPRDDRGHRPPTKRTPPLAGSTVLCADLRRPRCRRRRERRGRGPPGPARDRSPADPCRPATPAMTPCSSGCAPEPAPRRDPNPLVAGSTWPTDERALLSAFVAVRRARPSARLAIAPHQPSPQAVRRLRHEILEVGLPEPCPCRDSTGTEPLLLLDEVGPSRISMARVAWRCRRGFRDRWAPFGARAGRMGHPGDRGPRRGPQCGRPAAQGGRRAGATSSAGRRGGAGRDRLAGLAGEYERAGSGRCRGPCRRAGRERERRSARRRWSNR